MKFRVVVDVDCEPGAFHEFINGFYGVMGDYGDFAGETCIHVFYEMRDSEE